jgi:hypothetical protein
MSHRLVSVLQAQPDLQRDLPVHDLALLNVSARLRHFEPVHVAHGIGRFA